MSVSHADATARDRERERERWHAGHLIGWENEIRPVRDEMNFNKVRDACDTGQILSGNLISLFWFACNPWCLSKALRAGIRHKEDASLPTDPCNAALAVCYK